MAGTKVLVDSGPLAAYLNANDQWHLWATKQWEAIFEPMATCGAVLSETTFLLQEDGLSISPLLELVERRTLILAFNLAQEFGAVSRLLRKHGDRPMSLADGCLVRMSESADNCRVFTTDKDFRIYRRHERAQIPLLAPF